jgi:SAM-dependent methyltransferase
MSKSYDDQVREQIEQYRDTEDMQALPGAFHLWSPEFIIPGMESVFGVGDINSFYVEAFTAASRDNPKVPVFASMGCGDGVVEIGIARALRERGIERFRFVCYDLSDILLDRFGAGIPPDLAENFELVVGDLNTKIIDTKFDAIMANHSLHHMVELERIFDSVYENLTDRGIFVTNDMIGRNGHMRWPEALGFLHAFWGLLAEKYKYNHQLKRLELAYDNMDCSAEGGFEGIRAQDILPLLREKFHFDLFLGFGNLIDVFIDRGFGHNFNPHNPSDLAFIDTVAQMDELLLEAGYLKPTHLVAAMTKTPLGPTRYWKHLSPDFCVRLPGASQPKLTQAAA